MIREATIADIPTLIDIALPSWRATYPSIISQEQIDYMLEQMYSPTALREQMQLGHRSFLYDTDIPSGMMSVEHCKDPSRIKIHKLYIRPDRQGRGIGRALLDAAEDKARRESCDVLELRVNRANPAVNFYRRVGFETISEVNTPYGVYVLNDYILHRKVV